MDLLQTIVAFLFCGIYRAKRTTKLAEATLAGTRRKQRTGRPLNVRRVTVWDRWFWSRWTIGSEEELQIQRADGQLGQFTQCQGWMKAVSDSKPKNRISMKRKAATENAYFAVTGMEFWALHSRQRRTNTNAKLARKDGKRVICSSTRADRRSCGFCLCSNQQHTWKLSHNH